MRFQPVNAVARAARGVGRALRARPKVFAWVAAGVFALNIFLPLLVLSLARKPFDLFTFNPWLSRLPEWLASPEVPWGRRLASGPCSVMGCGVPVLPVIGLAFTGVSSATLTFFADLSRIAIWVVLSAVAAGVAWYGWLAGAAQSDGRN